MNEATEHAVVVGAGIFGVTAALELRRRGWRVTLVDRGTVPHEDASSTDISKMVRMDYGSDVFYHELAEAALDGWDRWNDEWHPPLYHDEGFLVLAPGPMEPGGFEYESFRVLEERGYAPRRLDPDQLSRRFPAWNAERYPDGYLSPRGGWAESGAVVSRLLVSALESGVTLHRGRCLEILDDGTRATGIAAQAGPGGVARRSDGNETSSQEVISADHVVVCAGAWTPVVLPVTASLLEAVAQPVLHFGVEDPDDFRGPAFPPFAADISGSGWYGFPALDDGRVKLGHHGDGQPVAPDAKGAVGEAHVARARAFFREALPELADAPVVGSRICLYCDSVDGDLLVGRPPGAEGITVAAGGSGHAFKFAPVLGDIIADAVEGRDTPRGRRFRWRTVEARTMEEARFHEQTGEARR